MELRTIDSTFQPAQVIDGYKSLVWTERYRDAGDFVMKNSDIDRTIAALPLGTMLGVRGSRDCKFVESHVIDKDEDGEWFVTSSGRSFESFLENRVAHEGQVRMFTADGDPDLPTPDYAYQIAGTGEASSKYAYEIIRYKTMLSADTVNYIPNLTCTVNSDVTLAGGKPRQYITVQIGTAYERVMEILAIDDLGLRTLLPAVGSSTLTLNIYQGLDVSENVVLSTSAGHFESSSYVMSINDYKNAAIAHAEWDWTYSNKAPAGGLQRRIGWVDAGDITHSSKPTPANPDEKELQSRIASYLSEHKKPFVFSGEVSVDVPYQYGVHYGLGDIVRVIGDYGLNQQMRVSEYIRTEDEEGEKSYPVLVQAY